MTEYLPRLLDARLRDALRVFPVSVIDGPRGCGKTTSAMQVAKSVVSLPHDLPSLEVAPERFLSSLEPPVLVDEWQLGGVELLWTIKKIVDQDPIPGRFVLTGSVEPASYGPTYPLTGRSARLVMRPMTAGEVSGKGDRAPLLQNLIEGEGLSITAGEPSDFNWATIFRSGFPFVRELDDASMFLTAYAASIAERAATEGRDAAAFMRTMRTLAVLEGRAVPDQRVWTAADINKATWKAYEGIAERTWVSQPLPAYSSNRLQRLTSYPKRFLADTALSLALAELTPALLESNPERGGRYLESYVMQQLRPQVDMIGGHLFHLRTDARQREIDGIVECSVGLIAVEVKAASRVESKDLRHIKWFKEQNADRFLVGIVIYTGGDVREVDDDIYAIPLSRLLEA